jgi:hypothetical protein
MVRRRVALLGALLALCAIVGCGFGSPSEKDVAEAVKRYYTRCQENLLSAARFPGGLKFGVDQVQVAEVRTVDRGKPFSPDPAQSARLPKGATPKGYPVRVHVSGSVGIKYPKSSSPFDGELDFVLYYVRPQPSNDDPETTGWVVE